MAAFDNSLELAIQCRAMRKLTVLLILVGLAATLMAAVRPAYADDDVGWLLGQINGLRAANGLGPLTLNPQLMNSATQHSQYLATNPWTHPHIEANGSTPQSRIAAAGFTGAPIGENVYGGGLATAAIAFNWWVASPIHLQGMIHPAFGQIGIGVATGPYGKFFTTDFGGGGAAAAPPTSVPANPQAPQNSQPAATQPKPTRRPFSPVPTVTPSITWTPSPTFTALPSRTPTATGTLEPPTPTAIVLEVSPQPGAQVLMIATFTALPSATPLSPSLTSTTQPIAASVASLSPKAETSSSTASDPIRALIPFAIGLQVLILGGVLLRRNRHSN